MAISIKLKDKYWDTSGIVHGHTTLNTYLDRLVLNKIYPVGSIYMSVNWWFYICNINNCKSAKP